MELLLSISLLASNRRESLARCLDSLKPLLAKVPSELVIVWTGTDDEARKIAEQYTPQLIPFRWSNDFSAARNAGLESAQGEWFLYIDDDEWFDDTEEICQFFLSGEYKRYQSAHYIQRNYQNWNGTKYADFSAFRMVKRVSGIHFRNSIHEELYPRMEPCKYFQTIVHHYGYADEGEETAQAYGKRTRNIPLLLHSIQENPGLLKNYLQLAKEFELAGKWNEAENFCRKGLSLCKNEKDSYAKEWLLAYLAHLLGKKTEKAAAIKELEEILEKMTPCTLTRLVLYQELVHLYTEHSKPAEALEYGKTFEKLLSDMEQHPERWKQQSYGEFDEGYVKNPENLYPMRANALSCALEIGDFENASLFLSLFPWEEEALLCRYYPLFEQFCAKYGDAFTDILLETAEHMAVLPTYLLFQKSLRHLQKGNRRKGELLYVQCIGQANDAYLQQLLLKTGILHQLELTALAKLMNLDTWNACTAEVIGSLPYSSVPCVRKCEEGLIAMYPLHGICLKKRRLELKLLKGFPLWEEFAGTLEEYCKCFMEYYQSIYRDEMFGADAWMFLPDEYRFAAITLKALDAMKIEQTSDAVRMFGDAIRIYPAMTGVITELFRQAVCQMDLPAVHTDGEFSELARQMKSVLHTLLDAGETEQAEDIVGQLLPVMPGDLELIWIRQELIRRKKS